jgi:hypothetical protein
LIGKRQTAIDRVNTTDVIRGFQGKAINNEPHALLTGCLTDATSLCLGGGRFKVRTTFRTPSQTTSQTASAVPIASDSGAFSFFSANNLELLVKVVDGGAFNGRIWVFHRIRFERRVHGHGHRYDDFIREDLFQSSGHPGEHGGPLGLLARF